MLVPVHNPEIARWIGRWQVEYKRDGVAKSHGFATATAAGEFGIKLQSGELDDDVLLGRESGTPITPYVTAEALRAALLAVCDAARLVGLNYPSAVVNPANSIGLLDAARKAALSLIGVLGVPR